MQGLVDVLPSIAAIFEDEEFLGELLGAAETIVSSLGEGLVNSASSLMSSATSLIKRFAAYLSEEDRTKKLVDAAMSILRTLAEGLITAIPELASAALDIIVELANYLVSPENLNEFVATTVTIITEIGDGLIACVDRLTDAAVQIITSLTDYLTTNPDNLVKLADGALKVVLAVAQAIIDNAPELLDAAITMVSTIIDDMTDPEKINERIAELGKFVDEIGQTLMSPENQEKYKEIGGKIGKLILESVWELLDAPRQWALNLGAEIEEGVERALSGDTKLVNAATGEVTIVTRAEKSMKSSALEPQSITINNPIYVGGEKVANPVSKYQYNAAIEKAMNKGTAVGSWAR